MTTHALTSPPNVTTSGERIIMVGTTSFMASEVSGIRKAWLYLVPVREIAKRYRVSPWAIKELAKRGWE